MKNRVTSRDWLPLAKSEGRASQGPSEVPTGEAFRPAWIDFERGIRVGNLEPHERITRILKHRLEERYTTPFVTDRWGRGVYWQWICWVPRENRQAKPVSSGVNFGSAKLYISIDKTRRFFQFGLAVERGIMKGRPPFPGILLKKDWDWHRLMGQCVKGSPFDAELKRLVHREGFTASVLGQGGASFSGSALRSARQIRSAAARTAPGTWAGFDLYYPMPENEVLAASGWEIVQAVMGAFSEVVPLMNMCMQVSLRARGSEIPSGTRRGSRQPA